MQTQTIHYIPPVSQTATRIRIAAYARVSGDSADQLGSYAAQVEHYDQLIRQNPNWDLVDIYADEGLTGTRADTREDFQRMLVDCRRGRIDKVLVKSISRFARNSRDCLASVRELKTLGVGVYFEKEKIDTGDMGSELMLSFYGAAAQEESLSISGNMRWSYERRMKSGEFITCRAPYGYRLINGNLIIEPFEASIVQRIFDDYLSGIGMMEIAQKLNSEGIHKGAGRWSQRGIHVILLNEKYTGNALLQKTYTTKDLPFRKMCNKGEQPMFYVENSHPAIINQLQYNNAQRLMAKRAHNRTAEKYPFSLLIRCELCGATFLRRVTNGKAYWVCRSHDQGRSNCPNGRIPEAVLEHAFLRLHHKLRLHRHTILSPMLEQLQTLQKRSAFSQSRVATIDTEILALGRQTGLLHRLYSAGHMDTVHYYEQGQSLNSQVNTLRRERRQLLERSQEDEAIDRTATLLDILSGSLDQLETFDPDLFGSMVRRIIIPNRKQAQFTLINGLEVNESL